MQEPGGSGNRDNTSIPHTHSRIQRNLKDGLGLPGLGTGAWVKSRRSPRASESHSQLGGVQSMKRHQQLQRRAPTPGLTQTDPDDASWSPPPDGEWRTTPTEAAASRCADCPYPDPGPLWLPPVLWHLPQAFPQHTTSTCLCSPWITPLFRLRAHRTRAGHTGTAEDLGTLIRRTLDFRRKSCKQIPRFRDRITGGKRTESAKNKVHV